MSDVRVSREKPDLRRMGALHLETCPGTAKPILRERKRALRASVYLQIARRNQNL